MTSLLLSRTIFAGVSLIFQSFFTLNSVILLLIKKPILPFITNLYYSRVEVAADARHSP